MHRALKILAYRVVTNIALYELNLPVECIDGLFRAATRCGQILLYWNFTTVFPTAQINFVISGRVFEESVEVRLPSNFQALVREVEKIKNIKNSDYHWNLDYILDQWKW